MGRFNVFIFVFLFCFLTTVDSSSRYKHYHRAPIINLNGADELIGSLREDEHIVTVSPQLRILPETGPICRYELSNGDQWNHSISAADLFESKILNKEQGTALIRLKGDRSVDCMDKEFHVQIQAVRCADDGSKSEPVQLKIAIKDTNNNAPEFDAPWYTYELEEGKVAEIARLKASDRDCGHPYGKICRYEITNMENSLFQIDDQGILSTIRPLNRSRSESHILTIVAHDCGMLQSKSTLITVNVLPHCIDEIRQGKKSSDEASPTNGMTVAENVEISFCPRVRIHVLKV